MSITRTIRKNFGGFNIFVGPDTPDARVSNIDDLWNDTTGGAGVLKTYDGANWNAGTSTVADGAVTNAKVNASAAIAFSKLATLARGSILRGNSSNACAAYDAKTSGQILVGDGTDLVSVAVSGNATLAANGALSVTGLTMASQEQGDVVYFNGTNWVVLHHGTSGQSLLSGGHGANPSWGVPTLTTTSNLANSVTMESGANDVVIAATTQTVGDGALTIPDFAGVADTFAFVTLAQTLVNKTLTSPTMGTSVILKNATRNITLAWAEPAGSARQVTFPDPGADVNVLYDASSQTVTNKTLTDTTCTFGANGALTKTLGFDLSALTAGNKLTLAAAAGTAQTLTLPNATDTLVGKATTDVFTNKSYNCDGAGNVLTNVNLDECDPIAATTGTYGIRGCVCCVNAGAATNTIFNANAPFKFRIIDAWAVATKACNGNWKLDNGTNDVTANVAYGADKVLSRCASIDDQYWTISANGTLRLISSDATDTAMVYISIQRVD